MFITHVKIQLHTRLGRRSPPYPPPRDRRHKGQESKPTFNQSISVTVFVVKKNFSDPRLLIKNAHFLTLAVHLIKDNQYRYCIQSDKEALML